MVAILNRRKFAMIIIIGLISCGMILWVVTGRWMANGQNPVAKGSNEFAIILGAKVNGEVPSLSLRYRLEAALDYGRAYPHVTFILSGGQGPGEAISEAEAMKIYLLENGIAEEQLILESASTSTYENIAFSKRLLPETIQSITIITSDYHLARSKKIAHNLGLQTDVISAKTPKIVEMKLTMRERAALIKTYVVGY